MRLCLQFSVTPDAERQMLADLANIVARANASIFRNASRPPRCAAEIGIRYRPPTRADHRSASLTILGAGELIARGWGACGDLAAFDAGAALARGIEARVVISAGPWGAGSYHATVATARVRWDPSAMAEQGQTLCPY